MKLLEESDEELCDDDVLDPTYRINDSKAEERESEFEEPQANTSRRKTKKKIKQHAVWSRNDSSILSFEMRLMPNDRLFDSTSIVQLVELMWPLSLFAILAEQTDIRNMMETGQELRCSAREIQKFLGKFIIMATMKLLRIHMYWKQGY